LLRPPTEVIGWKQALVPTEGRVLGRFADGAPALVHEQHDKGLTVIIGFLPGLAYLKSGLPLRPADRGARDMDFSHFLPTSMDATIRERLTEDFAPEDLVKPVLCSELFVETTCIDTARPPRLAVPLMNFTGRPIAKLTVTVRELPSARRVRSVVQGKLTPRFDNGEMTVELRLDVADMLLIDR
jgi:hypothetical protein